jgi:GT2 family glycosyltransferase
MKDQPRTCRREVTSETSVGRCRVAVVVVTWNGAEASRRCLRSLRKLDYQTYRVCLIDNGSQPGFAGPLRAEFPEVEIISLPENLGYAGGCNAGIDWAREHSAEYVLLLNDDTTVHPGLVRALLRRAKAVELPAIIAPKILMAHRPGITWSAGGFIRRPWFKADHLGEGEPAAANSEACEVEWASGCALFFPLSLAGTIGPLDERFFLYLEDAEWCLRARRRGFPVWYEPAAEVWHEVSAVAGRLDTRIKRYYSYRNHYLLAFSHTGLTGRMWFGFHYVVTLAKCGLRWLLFPAYRRNSWYHARTRALLDVARQRWGKAPYDDQLPEPAAVTTPGEVAV